MTFSVGRVYGCEMIDEAELLRRYAEEGSEASFAELVRRNLDIMYGVALRHVGDGHRAQDIVQSVFIDLARKARSLHRHPALLSWLFTSTRFAARKSIRSEMRRQIHEREALAMELSNDHAPDWEHLRPLLDEALDTLGERDREIVLLRYFRGLSFADVAASLRVNEGAARMRIDRALDRLNRILATRGINSTAAALGVALAAQPVVAAPAALGPSIVSAAASSGVAAGGLGAAVTFFAMNKLSVAAGALLLTVLATAVVEVHANFALRAALASAPATDTGALTREHHALEAEVAKLNTDGAARSDLQKVRARIALLKARPEGVTDETLHPPQNRGRATPEDAMETFCWAVDQRNLDLVAAYVRFADDTPQNREAFLANFSAAVRARYQTPERLAAAAMFGATIIPRGAMPDELQSMQVVRVKEKNGPTEVRIELWLHSATGREVRGGDTYTLGPDGWGLKPMSLQNPNIIKVLQDRLDPTTGEYRVPKMPAGSTP